MQPKTSISRENSRTAHRLSRRRIFIVALVAIVGLSLTLVGCSPNEGAVESVGGHTAVVDEWIKAANAEDVTQFEKLHTEDVVFHSHLQKSPTSGRGNLWDAFSQSNARPMQRIYMLAQEDFVCLQATAADPKRSFLYVFRFEGDSIAQVDEYTAAYDLSDVPLFDGAEITTDDAGLPARIDTLNAQVDALNERDYSRFIETFSDDAIHYGPLDEIPLRGAESIGKDVEDFFGGFPTAEQSTYRAFGQGNLVCQQVATKNPHVSLGQVMVFEGGKVSRSYQYLSDAVLSR
jgi:ketosteroid isomerase-like protein